MEPSKLSIDEMEFILAHWENKIDGVKWSDETRNDCIEALTEMKQPMEWWMEHLVNVPDNVSERYKTMMKKLLESKMITQEDYEEELALIPKTSPAQLARNGKKAAEWWRKEQEYIREIY